MEASLTLFRQNQEFPRATVQASYILLALSKAIVSMYADDSTLYRSATAATKMTAEVCNKVLLCLLNNTINKAGPTGPSSVTPGLLFSRVVRCHKERHGKISIGQIKAARLALGCTQRANINNMHVNLSWLKMEERLKASLLVFVRGIDMLNAPSYLFKILAHSSDAQAYPTRHATRGLFTVSKSRTDCGSSTVLHRAMTTFHIM